LIFPDALFRETGYVWLRRYRALGLEGLLELNRAAKRHPAPHPLKTMAEQKVSGMCPV